MKFAFLCFTLFYTVQLHRYYIVRDNQLHKNAIHLTLEGNPTHLCRIKLFTKDDTYYFYRDVSCGSRNICEVPCSGEYTFHTDHIAPHHFLQIASKAKTDYLKVVHTTSSVPFSSYHFDGSTVAFVVKHMCEESPFVCQIRSGQFTVQSYILDSQPQCGAEYMLRSLYNIYNKPLELYCGPHNPKLFFDKNMFLSNKKDLLKRYPVRIAANAADNKIDIIFEEPIPDTICKFEIVKKDGTLESKCGLGDGIKCYQICQNVTMETDYNKSSNKEFHVKISARGVETESMLMSTDKKDFQIKDILTYGATLGVSALHAGSDQCKVEMFVQENYVKVDSNRVGLKGHTVFASCENDIKLLHLEADTKYVVNVQYKASSSEADAIQINKIFKTAKIDDVTADITTYPQNVVIVPQQIDHENYKAECMIMQALKGTINFVRSVCEESYNCYGLCTSEFTVTKLQPDTEYTFKAVPQRFYSETEALTKNVRTGSLFKKVELGYKWTENDLEITVKVGDRTDGICDFTFVEKTKEQETKILAVHDRTNGWNEPCNSRITFFDVPEYKSATVIVKRRYDGEPVELELFIADPETVTTPTTESTVTTTRT